MKSSVSDARYILEPYLEAPEEEEEMPPAWRGPTSDEAGSFVLKVPFAEKENAKRLGAQWDKRAKTWFVPPSLAHNVNTSRFKAWLPDNAAKRHRAPGDYMAEHPDRVYLCTLDHRAVKPTWGLAWDADFPKAGAWYVLPQHTNDLSPWRRWLPADIEAGGAATAAADADTSQVHYGHPCLPPFTLQWVYFWAGGALMRRRRRWAKRQAEHRRPFVEAVTQSEYNRRVDDPAWPTYKGDDAYERADDVVPDWHAAGCYHDVPDVFIDRKKLPKVDYGELENDTFAPWGLYMDPATVDKKRGGYKDKDEVVIPAPAAAAVAAPQAAADAVKNGKNRRKKKACGGELAAGKVAKKVAPRGRKGARGAASGVAVPLEPAAAAAPAEADDVEPKVAPTARQQRAAARAQKRGETGMRRSPRLARQ